MLSQKVTTIIIAVSAIGVVLYFQMKVDDKILNLKSDIKDTVSDIKDTVSDIKDTVSDIKDTVSDIKDTVANTTAIDDVVLDIDGNVKATKVIIDSRPIFVDRNVDSKPVNKVELNLAELEKALKDYAYRIAEIKSQSGDVIEDTGQLPQTKYGERLYTFAGKKDGKIYKHHVIVSLSDDKGYAALFSAVQDLRAEQKR